MPSCLADVLTTQQQTVVQIKHSNDIRYNQQQPGTSTCGLPSNGYEHLNSVYQLQRVWWMKGPEKKIE